MINYEECPHCGTQVQYDPEVSTYIKCTGCGKTLHIFTSFEQVQQRIKAQIEAGEQAKKDLALAEKEKRAAQEKLSDAVSALAGIQSNQKAEQKALKESLDGQKTSETNQQALSQLLQTLRKETSQGQDTLGQLLQAAIRNQETGEGKLHVIQGLAQDILAAEDNIAELVQACACHIHADKEEQNALIRQLIAWSQTAHQEDTRRLEAIVQVSSTLLDSIQAVDQKVDQLQRTADRTQQTLESFHGEWKQDKLDELTALYHQAQSFQRDRQFDQAEAYYRQVLIKGGKDAEVYWRIVLCHYCVEYQDDGQGRAVPTILYPDLSDPEDMSIRQDLSAALLALTDGEQKQYYLRELDTLDKILNTYRENYQKVQYDVFISVKQEDHGHFTRDSDKASTLYDLLTDWGLKVFNSRRTPPLSGKNYEPYIIAALLSAKVMIVVGTKTEYMNAPWVRNEWMRFSWLRKNEKKTKGQDSRLLFCYLADGMAPSQIPSGLNPSVQAVVESPDATAILKRNLQVVFPQRFKDSTSQQQPQDDVQDAVSQMEAWLVLEEYEKVTNYYIRLSSIPKTEYRLNIRLPLYALCAKFQIAFIEDLPVTVKKLEDENLFRQALKRAKNSEEDTAWLKSLVEENKKLFPTQGTASESNAGQGKASSGSTEKPEQVKQKETPPTPPQTAAKAPIDISSISDVQQLLELAKFYPNNTELLLKIGNCYYDGKGITRDYKNAVQWYKKAADQGDSFAQNRLGLCYEYGCGVQQDYAQAVKYYRLAADQENSDAQSNLGWCYQNGHGVQQDYGQAVKYFRLAADQGKATDYYQKAANQGDKNAANKIMEMKHKNEERSNRMLWKSQGRCSYCGGQFNIFKNCKQCGKKKDY